MSSVIYVARALTSFVVCWLARKVATLDKANRETIECSCGEQHNGHLAQLNRIRARMAFLLFAAFFGRSSPCKCIGKKNDCRREGAGRTACRLEPMVTMINLERPLVTITITNCCCSNQSISHRACALDDYRKTSRRKTVNVCII